MNDDYSISQTPSERRGGALRPILWVLLILSAATNAVLSSVANPFVSSAFGLVALACATTLIVHHYRHRAR
ncbi:hypothetical protein ACQPZX_12545 [Actinoplanes sp. CA-142083]|uniref:hypothetical protein n=1 Tax=Actinoplanes sp. CA-142083 TaxID=3239903 RepID=UPI003D916454